MVEMGRLEISESVGDEDGDGPWRCGWWIGF